MSRATRSLIARQALILLALLPVGLTWGAARVESRSPNPDWVAADSGPQPGSPADMLSKMEFLQQEVQELRGKVEEQNYQLQQLKDSQKKLYADLDSRLQAQGGTANKAAATTTSGISIDDKEIPVEAKPSANQATTTNIDIGVGGSTQSQAAPITANDQLTRNIPHPEEILAEEKAYQHAYRLVQKKDYEAAATAFQSLVKSFPHGKYLPNAKYWLGEIYLVKGSNELAYEAFETVYKNYPQHPKAADCLLKLGYVEYAKGDWKRSQTLLTQVKNQFPGTTSAQLADSRLERMAHEGHL